MRKFRNRLMSALLAALLALNPLCVNMISAYAESSAGAGTESVSRGGERDTSASSSEKADKSGGESVKTDGKTDRAGKNGEKSAESGEKSDKAGKGSDESGKEADKAGKGSDESGEKADKADKGSSETGEKPDKGEQDSAGDGERSWKGGIKNKENGRKHDVTAKEKKGGEEAGKEAGGTDSTETETTDTGTSDTEAADTRTADTETAETGTTDTEATIEEIAEDVAGEELFLAAGAVEDEETSIIVRLLPLKKDKYTFSEKPDEEELADILPKYLYAVADEADEDEAGDDDEEAQTIYRLPVSWECWDDFTETDLESYLFDACPEWNEDVYGLAEGEELPSITVVITADMVILTKTVDGVEVTVTAPSGVLPEDAKLKVDKITAKTRVKDAADAIARYRDLEDDESEYDEAEDDEAEYEEAEDEAAPGIDLFDVKILNADEEEIQPEGTVTLSFCYTDVPESFETEEFAIYQFESDETTEVAQIDAELDGDTIECDIEYFSVFAILSDIEYLAEDLYSVSFTIEPHYIYDDYIFTITCNDPESSSGGDYYIQGTSDAITGSLPTTSRGLTFNSSLLGIDFFSNVGDYEIYVVVN